MAFVIAECEAAGTILNVLWNTETEPGKHSVCQKWSHCRSGRREGPTCRIAIIYLVGWPEYWQENYFKMPVHNQCDNICRCVYGHFHHTTRSWNTSPLSWVPVADSSCWPQLDTPTCSIWLGLSSSSLLVRVLWNLWLWWTCCIPHCSSASRRSVTAN